MFFLLLSFAQGSKRKQQTKQNQGKGGIRNRNEGMKKEGQQQKKANSSFDDDSTRWKKAADEAKRALSQSGYLVTEAYTNSSNYQTEQIRQT